MKSPTLTINSKKVAFFLFLSAILFGVIHLILFYFMLGKDINLETWNFMGLFDLDSEANLPTWFSQTLLLVIAILLGTITFWRVKTKKPKSENWQWASLSIMALLMSIDEGSVVHEKFSLLVARYTGDLSGTPLYFAWVIVGIFLVLVMLLIFFRFWWRLPTKTKWLLFSAVVVFLAGSIGMELLGGYYISTESLDGTYRLMVLAEELLEMLGSVIAIYALLEYVKDEKITLAVQVK